MKKKFTGLAIVICMLVCGVLTSCGSNAQSDLDVAPSRKPLTMEIYAVSEKTIPAEDLQLVQDALNKITKSKYMTEIHLVFVPENEYQAKLDAAFAYQDEQKASMEESSSIKKSEEDESRRIAQENRKKGITEAPTRATKETVTTEETTERIIYPTIDPEKPQADIFLIRGVDQYLDLALTKTVNEKEVPGRLAALDEELTNRPKVLKDYIYPPFLEAPKVAGATYCIPNNHQLGEATYLAIRSDLAALYDLDVTKITDVTGITKFLTSVKEADPNALLLNQAAPIDKYFDNIKEASFPIASTAATGTGTPAKPEKISIVNKYDKASKLLSTAALMAQYKADGLITPADPNAEYAAKFVTGSVGDLESWQAADPVKYDYILYSAPRATAENCLEAAFGINASTANVTRAMEILTLMNTNAEIKNLLTYGVEGKHWIYNDDGLVQRINDNYSMNPLYTGNTYLSAIEEGQSPDIYKNAKIHNLESITALTIAFSIDYNKLKDEQKVAYVKAGEIGKKYYDRIVNGEDLVALAQELLDNTQPAPEPVADAEGKMPPAPPTVEEVKAAGQPIIDSGDLTKIAGLIGERITAEMELSGFAALLQTVKDSAPAPAEEAAA